VNVCLLCLNWHRMEISSRSDRREVAFLVTSRIVVHKLHGRSTSSENLILNEIFVCHDWAGSSI